MMKQRFLSILGSNKKRGTILISVVLLSTVLSGLLVACSLQDSKSDITNKNIQSGTSSDELEAKEVTETTELKESEQIQNSITNIDDSSDSKIEKENQLKIFLEDFSKRFFSGDKEGVKQFLVKEFEGNINVWDGTEEVSDTTLKGLDAAKETPVGELFVASLEFRATPQDDSFTYLTMEVMNNEDGWKISSYYLEK